MRIVLDLLLEHLTPFLLPIFKLVELVESIMLVKLRKLLLFIIIKVSLLKQKPIYNYIWLYLFIKPRSTIYNFNS